MTIGSLSEVLSAPSSTIEDVLAKMERIDAVLDQGDGLKWFNLLYLMVTKQVLERPPGGGWSDPDWITLLDVKFANLYFDALQRFLLDPATSPKAWRVMFSERANSRIMRIQFAVCGMNAHINRDLQVALFETSSEMGISPERGGRQHQDFEYVNTILETVEAGALEFLATGIVGMIDEHLGTIDNILARWSIRRARETAWFNAEILANLPHKFIRDQHVKITDQYTSFAGRLLLVPI